MLEDDKALLDKLKKGDPESFNELVTLYRKKVYNLALRMSGSPDDAVEISQEVFLKIYRSIRNFREEASLSTWVYRITSNVCIDEIRKQKNRKLLYVDDSIKSEDGELKRELEDHNLQPSEIAEKNELKKAVTDGIQSLSEEYRTVIVLRDIHGLSYDEISRITGCPEGTVKSRISRARSALAGILKKNKELLDGYLRQNK
jgi:RNA polymerase sigma-70 factor (ECF subfamily)